MLPNILEASKKCKISEERIWIFDVLGQPLPEDFRSWRALLEYGEKEWERFDDEQLAGETTAARLFSMFAFSQFGGVLMS